ncbi:ATPase-like, ATP-binding domain protein [Metarhizium guizhouense ARSEF 977]|uniref:ATPase-like, ATP-binding domain protein n=1 Tax=Metarhizium guizhouense (strain ARSEF 977) TaxID=1276136 RepID=A0A0B4GZ08_METGA|nr:ATPase-like, ATP-binding domain protein [Metarhizium guizhouense ARSEF 977]
MGDSKQHDKGSPAPPSEPPHLTQHHEDPASLGHLRAASSASSSRDTQTAETSSVPDERASSVGGHGAFSPWSAGSERQLGHHSAASDISGDRVFPIRSVISVDPTPRQSIMDENLNQSSDADSRRISGHWTSYRGDSSSDTRRLEFAPMSPTAGQPSGSCVDLRRKRAMSGPVSSIHADAVRQGSVAPLQLEISASDHGSQESGPLGVGDVAAGPDSASITSGNQSLGEVPHITTRFTHVETDEGHAIITGRDGILQQCEDEPIHTPGAVQGFGVLLALREDGSGGFSVRYASENSGKIIGYTPKQLFRLKSFLDILTEEQQDNLLDHIDFIRDEDADPAVNGPEVLSLSIKLPKTGKSIKLWCAIHINNAHPDLVICEFELDDDREYPLRPADELTPDTPHDTLHSNPTLEEIEESTEILSKPLRILRSARKRRGEQGAMQVFDIMSQVQEQLASAPNLDTFLKILVGIVKELTGFHRVMIYQFDSSFNGKVVTELVDTSQTVDLYKGLHFPASDIPRQARELYKINKVRLLYDRDLDTARMVCRTKEDLEVPLDMTHAYLRAMSPIHLKYLANMAVRSSMSISINAFNELWGLISCHAYGNHGMRVSFPIRKMCRLVGDTASRNIERLSYASRLQARKLINTAPTDKNPSGYIIASSDDLLKLFDADFGLLSIQGETKMLGTIEHSQEALAMLEYLRMRKLTAVASSQDVREDFPDLKYPPGFQVIAGLLYVPLSVGGNDFIVFFRRGQIKEVKWAGNPYEKTVRDGTVGYLEPRKSFKIWNETVLGKCREWNEEQVETAAVLCLVYGKFIEVWRQKEAALENSKLTRLLLANSAHEVRTPLNAIINYLEIALEGSLDHETRENLARSHSASKSLIYVINDLLDLTKAEEGQSLIKDEVFDLSACIEEATEPFHVDAKRKGIDYQVTKDPGLPQFVHGDSRRVRQALSNITANAVAHTHQGSVTVEMFVSEIRDGMALVDFVVADSGIGMNPRQLDALFRDLEQVSSEELESSSPEPVDKQHETRTLGLGLAVVARIVRNMDGQLRLKSEEGQGSRFVVQLPFHLPDDSLSLESGGHSQDGSSATHTGKVIASASPNLKATPAGEIMLIERGSHSNMAADIDKRSTGTGSAGSRRSVESLVSHGSQKSDADRLIDAIQTPLSLNENQTGYFTQSQSSKGNNIQPASLTSTGTVRPPSPGPHKQDAPSHPHPRHEPGTAEIRDSKTPVKAVKMPDEFVDLPSRIPKGDSSGVLFELPSQKPQKSATVDKGASSNKEPSLNILVAEDDPINMKILQKRLERVGHTVQHTVNGEDCAMVYKDKSPDFDVILMDMQMPIVDGLTSTKMVRSTEQSSEHKGHSAMADANRRIPIFAVSASLVEENRQVYVDAGFDGWILKPIDFKRLSTLLAGIHESETRKACLYLPGEWERGGWFSSGEGDGSEDTTCSQTTPTADTESHQLEGSVKTES